MDELGVVSDIGAVTIFSPVTNTMAQARPLPLVVCLQALLKLLLLFIFFFLQGFLDGKVFMKGAMLMECYVCIKVVF